MTVHSAGIALCRLDGSDGTGDGVTSAQILIVHPGGPFWANKDEHAWSLPKGEFDPDSEQPEDAARREFAEELGVAFPGGAARSLASFRAGRKTIWPWLVLLDSGADFPLADHEVNERFPVAGNHFEMEWPPRSGEKRDFPEVDVASWVRLSDLPEKLHKGQLPVVAAITRGLENWVRSPDSFTTW